MSWLRPKLSELIERSRADVESRQGQPLAWLRHSVQDVLVRMLAGALDGLYGYLAYLARMVIPATAEGEFLDRWTNLWGTGRKAATAASATAIFTGEDGTAIPAGTEIIRADGTLYRTVTTATIDGGAVEISVEAAEAGPSGSLSAGEQLVLSQTIIGVSSAITLDADSLVPGTDIESDEAARERMLFRIQNPPSGGKKSDYERWALEVAGVTRAWVYPEWLGAGTVGVTFLMDGREDIVPTEADIDLVHAHVEDARPVTARLITFAPTPLPIDFIIELSPSTLEVRAAVVAEIEDFLRRDAEPGGTLWYSRVSEAVSVAAGEFRHRILSPFDDQALQPGEIAVLGNVTWVN